MAAILQPTPWARQPAFPATANKVRFPHLVSFWPLNDVGTIPRDIAGGNTAASSSGVQQRTDPRFGKTLFYSGNDNVRINSATGIATGNSVLSLSIWAKVTQTIVSPRQMIVINNSSGGGSTAAVQLLCKNDNTIAAFRESGQQLVASGFSPTIGRWFHVGYTWDGTTNRIYINGVEAANSTSAHATGALDHIYIGDYQAGGNESWRGDLALPAIFDVAMTPSEIYTLYNEPFVLCAPLPRRVFAGPDAGGVTGTVNYTNANDTLAASGTTTVTGTLARTNANDTLAAAGTTTVVGTLAYTNADDTLAASGTVGGGVDGSVNYTNLNDTLAAAGTTTVTGALAYTNANDTSAASGTTTVVGTLAYTNANDTLAASGTAGAVTGAVDYTNNNDTLLASGEAGQPGTLVIGGGFDKPKKKRKPVRESILEAMGEAEVPRPAASLSPPVAQEPTKVKRDRTLELLLLDL